jgi:hypothetical protein
LFVRQRLALNNPDPTCPIIYIITSASATG